MTYNLSGDAQSDLKRIFKYGVKQFGEMQADKHFWDIIEQLKFIGDNPETFPKIVIRGRVYRLCAALPETIYYHIDKSGSVQIDRILGRQNRERQFQ